MHESAEATLAEVIAGDEGGRAAVAENVQARRYFRPGCHRSPPYSADPTPELPVTERLCRVALQLPTGLQLTADEAAALGELVAFCCEQGRRLRLPAGTTGVA